SAGYRIWAGPDGCARADSTFSTARWCGWCRSLDRPRRIAYTSSRTRGQGGVNAALSRCAPQDRRIEGRGARSRAPERPRGPAQTWRSLPPLLVRRGDREGVLPGGGAQQGSGGRRPPRGPRDGGGRDHRSEGRIVACRARGADTRTRPPPGSVTAAEPRSTRPARRAVTITPPEAGSAAPAALRLRRRPPLSAPRTPPPPPTL